MKTGHTKSIDAPHMGSLHRFGRLFGQWRLPGTRSQHRRAAWQMRAASDALLRDIGLSRSELTTVTPLRPSPHR
jgi:uncharacterized protein YjiS (DUF1127 family)